MPRRFARCIRGTSFSPARRRALDPWCRGTSSTPVSPASARCAWKCAEPCREGGRLTATLIEIGAAQGRPRGTTANYYLFLFTRLLGRFLRSPRARLHLLTSFLGR